MQINKKIWIDLENTPHVLFFNPIIKDLKSRGYEVVVTARDYAQVYALAELFGIEHIKIGKHSGKNKIWKILGLAVRTGKLFLKLKRLNPCLAVSHGSRSQLLTSKLLQIPCLFAIDYEYGKYTRYLSPDLTLMPQVLQQNYKENNFDHISGYPGIKEDVYVQNYRPNIDEFNSKIGVNHNHVVVTMRPPATEAHYHNKQSDILFIEIVNYILKQKNTCLVILPRTKKQEEYIRHTWFEALKNKKIILPSNAINGLDLIWFSDLVISGGGTMIREAAALGVPAFSFFKGKIGAVDKYLSDTDRLVIIDEKNNISHKIKLQKRIRTETYKKTNRNAIDYIENEIMKMAEIKKALHVSTILMNR